MKNNEKTLYGACLVACAAAFLGVDYNAMGAMDWVVLALAAVAAVVTIAHALRSRKG